MKVKYVEVMVGAGGLVPLGAAPWEGIGDHLETAGFVLGDVAAVIKLSDLRDLIPASDRNDHLCYYVTKAVS